MEDEKVPHKKMKTTPTPQSIRDHILKTKTPLLIKNTLAWEVLSWSLDDWASKLGNSKVDVRLGTKQCTKVPQWENTCETVPLSLKDIFDYSNQDKSDTWVYFDYKHMKHNFKKKPELLQSLSWSDFGFPEKNGNDSTIWIGTKGAYTPCHMDSYGCNIVAQVYGRKLWILYPPSKTCDLKPTRVPYEESSIYSSIDFSCGLNIDSNLDGARVVILEPGDVLVVPKHWWHFVENLTTAISINMWIPRDSDHTSRLEESLVRFFVSSTLKTMKAEEGTPLLNPNEMDLLDEEVDLRQISWCMEQVLRQKQKSEDENSSCCNDEFSDPISEVPVKSASELCNLLVKKCGCSENENEQCDLTKHQHTTTIDDVISAFCHPDVISKVAEVLISMKKS